MYSIIIQIQTCEKDLIMLRNSNNVGSEMPIGQTWGISRLYSKNLNNFLEG